MESWQWAVLLKPVLAIIGAVAYFYVVIKGLRWAYKKLPKNRVVDFLFKERVNRRPDYGPGFDGAGGTNSAIELAALEDTRRSCADGEPARLRKLPYR